MSLEKAVLEPVHQCLDMFKHSRNMIDAPCVKAESSGSSWATCMFTGVSICRHFIELVDSLHFTRLLSSPYV